MTEGPSHQSVLALEDVAFNYGSTPIFTGLNLSIDKNHKIIAIVGPSGVGKSTLLKLLAGFEHPQSGRITVCGSNVTTPSADRPVVFQDHNLFPWKSVAQNIEFGLKARGESPQSRSQISGLLMQQMGLSENADHLPRVLSGGMQQRVGLARCLAVNPRCILMDEPFSSIDFRTKGTVVQHFLQHLQKSNSTAVLVTHDLVEAVTMASCVITITARRSVDWLDLTEPQKSVTDGVDDKVAMVKGLLDDD